MLFSEELSAALDERASRDELRKAELASSLLKALDRTITATKSELDAGKLKKSQEALKAGQALLAVFMKQHWPKGVPSMDDRPQRAGKGTSEIRRIMTALGAALDKLGDPGDRGFDDVVDVKIDRASDALFTRRQRVPRG